MNKLSQLVREALDRRREESQGCFIWNAAADELSDYGADAVAAIERELLALIPDESGGASLPRDLDSVMVVYARLIRQLELADRCVAFLRRLPPHFRCCALRGVHIVWSNNHPRPGALPDGLHRYVHELLMSATDLEQRIAQMALRDCRDDKSQPIA
jgi:hypothetical protein